LLYFATSASAQRYDYVQQGEFGITAGAAHYLRDINTRAALNRPKPALVYFSVSSLATMWVCAIGAHYAQVGYSDVLVRMIIKKRGT